MRFDVHRVRWENVDNALVAFALSAGIPHGTIIVISDDFVKQSKTLATLATRGETLQPTSPLSGG
jgi:hypothetical protein